jgi:molecular chaperone DnaK (HSP70)
MPRIVGIDLGTTNSLVAISENGVPRIIPGADGNALVPSVIYFGENAEILVGNNAKARMVDNPRHAIFSIKRFMGKGIEDVRDDFSMLPFEIAPESEHIIKIRVFGRDYTPGGSPDSTCCASSTNQPPLHSPTA